MKKLEVVIIATILLVALVMLVVSLGVIFTDYTQKDYNEFISDEQGDKCQTPPGYTDQEWREHMSHHPDRYIECLK